MTAVRKLRVFCLAAVQARGFKGTEGLEAVGQQWLDLGCNSVCAVRGVYTDPLLPYTLRALVQNWSYKSSSHVLFLGVSSFLLL